MVVQQVPTLLAVAVDLDMISAAVMAETLAVQAGRPTTVVVVAEGD